MAKLCIAAANPVPCSQLFSLSSRTQPVLHQFMLPVIVICPKALQTASGAHTETEIPPGRVQRHCPAERERNVLASFRLGIFLMGVPFPCVCFSAHQDAPLATPDFEDTPPGCCTALWCLQKLVRDCEILLKYSLCLASPPLSHCFLEGMDLKVLEMSQVGELRNRTEEHKLVAVSILIRAQRAQADRHTTASPQISESKAQSPSPPASP